MRRFFRKRLPAFLLTLVMVMTMVPAVSAKSLADLTYEVDKGDSVSFKEQVLKDGYRTIDIHSEGTQLVSCSEMGDLICERV